MDVPRVPWVVWEAANRARQCQTTAHGWKPLACLPCHLLLNHSAHWEAGSALVNGPITEVGQGTSRHSIDGRAPPWRTSPPPLQSMTKVAGHLPLLQLLPPQHLQMVPSPHQDCPWGPIPSPPPNPCPTATSPPSPPYRLHTSISWLLLAHQPAASAMPAPSPASGQAEGGQ